MSIGEPQYFQPRDDQTYSVGHPKVLPSTYLNGFNGEERHRLAQIPEDAFDLPTFAPFPLTPTPAAEEYAGIYNKTSDVTATLAQDAAIDATALNDSAAEAAFLKDFEDKPSPDMEIEYVAYFGNRGQAILAKRTTIIREIDAPIATFDTFDDAQKAAQALNEHEGY